MSIGIDRAGELAQRRPVENELGDRRRRLQDPGLTIGRGDVRAWHAKDVVGRHELYGVSILGPHLAARRARLRPLEPLEPVGEPLPDRPPGDHRELVFPLCVGRRARPRLEIVGVSKDRSQRFEERLVLAQCLRPLAEKPRDEVAVLDDSIAPRWPQLEPGLGEETSVPNPMRRGQQGRHQSQGHAGRKIRATDHVVFAARRTRRGSSLDEAKR